MPVAQRASDFSPRGFAFGAIVLQVRTDVAALMELATSRVLVVADRKFDPKAVAETHLRLRPLARKGQDDPGGGRTANIKTRILAVDVVVRHATDKAAEDRLALTDEGVGLLAVEDQVLDALDLHSPRSDDVPMLIEPMRETTTDDPNRASPGNGFVASTVYFEMRYLPKYRTDRT